MSFLSRFTQKKEKMEEVEGPISIETYAIGNISLLNEYGLENPLIVIGFPGSEHKERVVTRRETLIRYYLDRIFTKKRIKTKIESTEGIGSEKRDLRGNGELDRSYHNGSQFHFYESGSNGELKEVIDALESEYGLTIDRELPASLVSDLERII